MVVIVELLVFWAAMLAAYLLMKHAGCFSQPVLYPDLDHPFRYWWAQRLGSRPLPPVLPDQGQQKTRRA
ncbi:hypothetical protein BJN34_0065 [Cupriavidus necator]|uniref:Uncharacterized protein n=1 Tax=Cupriavidus necator TaxID=106590 RepID=A0A2P1DUX8_CUPNE|nr:hypothetical protein BJN34_0065 [Cupriavidus necator]